jgi:hypothetical protein
MSGTAAPRRRAGRRSTSGPARIEQDQGNLQPRASHRATIEALPMPLLIEEPSPETKVNVTRTLARVLASQILRELREDR